MEENSRASIRDALPLARRTGAFTERELAVLDEVLEDCLIKPEEGYRFEGITNEGALSGFLIWGRTPMTEKGYDIYWIAVDPALQGKGLGRSLMALVEEAAREETCGCILRLETSGREGYRRQRHFYGSCGFVEAGRIRDFYRTGDDLVTYVKYVAPQPKAVDPKGEARGEE